MPYTGLTNSLHATGSLYGVTSGNYLGGGQASYSASCFIRLNSMGALLPSFTNFAGQLFTVNAQNYLQIQGQTATTSPIEMGIPASPSGWGATGPYPVPGQVYHCVITWGPTTQFAYINGLVVGQGSLLNELTNNYGQPLKVGLLTPQSMMDVDIANLAIWNGYQLSASDVLALRDQTETPATLATPATAWYPFGGPLGTTAQAGDGFMNDVLGGNDITYFEEGWPGTVTPNTGQLTYGPPLAYVPPASVVPYIAKSGRLVFFGTVPTTAPQTTTVVTAVNKAPSIQVNGLTVQAVGPYWAQNALDCPFVIYQLPEAVAAYDVVTFTAPDGWLTTQVGVTAASTLASVTNYVGQTEQPFGGRPPFGMPTSKPTLQLGFNLSTGTANAGVPYSITKNWLKRVAWHNLITTDLNGHPLTIAGNASGDVLIGGYSQVDSLYVPNTTGIWTFIADEADPASPMVVSLASRVGSMTITSLPTMPGIMNANGAAIGKTWQWEIVYPANPAYWVQYLWINIEAANGANPGAWTLSNEFLFAPTSNGAAPQPTRTNPLGMDGNIVNTLTMPSGRTVACLRMMDSTLNPGGTSAMVDESDLRNADDFTWNTAPTTTLSITEVRNYSITAATGTPGSPYVYLWQAGPPAPSGSPGPFVTSPPSIGYLNWSGGGTQWFAGEFVTSAPHNLKTGQFVNMQTGGAAITVTSGSSQVQTTWLESANLVVWVTSATTFAFTTFAPTIASGSGQGQPGGINNVYGAQTVSFTATIVVPDPTTIPYEAAAAAAASLPNTNLWVNVPVCASNGGATAIAERIRDNTIPGRKVYVELSNEVWNFDIQEVFLSGLADLDVLGTPAPTGTQQGYALRGSQIHQIFVNVFNQRDINGNANRGNEIVRHFGGQFSYNAATVQLVGYVNTYNAANPTSPIQIDSYAVAPYSGYPTDGWNNPNIAASVNPTGGGTTGGLLAPGAYYLSYTWIDPLSGLETAVGTAESAQFTVASGNVPTAVISFPAASGNQGMWNGVGVPIPNWSTTANIYLTAANGAAGTEVLYQTISLGSGNTATATLSAANTGSTAPPALSHVPSFILAAASVWNTNPASAALGCPSPPWTRQMVNEVGRHYMHYAVSYVGSFSPTTSALSAYIPVNGQPKDFTPAFIGYEGSYANMVPSGASTAIFNTNNVANFIAQLSADVFYDPSTYDLETEYLRAVQEGGVTLLTNFNLVDLLGGTTGFFTWAYLSFGGQQWGRGDGSDGKATNLFIQNTGVSETAHNVSVRMQAWRDWANASNPAPRPTIFPRRYVPSRTSSRGRG